MRWRSIVVAVSCVVTSVAGGQEPTRAGTAKPTAPPDTVRGLYVNRWAAIGPRMWQLVELARTTEVNALVIDVKDDRGLVLYPSRVPLAQAIGADTTQPMSRQRLGALLDSMWRLGIHPIARVVVTKDPLLAARRPEWSIRRHSDTTATWLDNTGNPWLDPTHPEVWDYAANLAAEAVRLGFGEVQFDYVRFPDDPGALEETRYARLNGRTRARVIRDQLTRIRQRLRPLNVPMTIDVFGLTATDTSDMGIGQRWESFVDRADVVLPMTYPSHFAPGTYGINDPNARPYETIDHVLKDVRRRTRGVTGAARIVPWYQDFTLGSTRYTAEHVRLQILAGYANGFHSWMLWNSGSRYSEAALLRDSTATSTP